jgi:hypothetical protein
VSHAVSVLADVRTLLTKVRSELALRRARRSVAAALAARPPLPAGRFEAVVYFPDSAVNLYQLRQWYEPMRRLAERHPVVVVTRFPDATAQLLRECPLPVHLVSTIADLERWLSTQPVRAVFYVNQNRENFSVLRFAEPAHVFVSHGESDKSYMASNQLKAYDTVFVAGPAAVRRIARHVHGLPPEHLVAIGRPQVDVEHPAPPMPADGRVVVLYAPTWEGDRPSMSYSSVASHGHAIVAALVADPRYRVVYRPHPRTGVQDPRFGAASRALSRRLDAANREDPTAGHVVDVVSPFGWHLRTADVCITDVSAVAFDWLATGKPLLLTTPSADVATEPDTLAARLDPFTADDAPDVVHHIERARDSERLGHAAVVQDYFGDTAPGAAMARFLAAADDVISTRARVHATAVQGGAQEPS